MKYRLFLLHFSLFLLVGVFPVQSQPSSASAGLAVHDGPALITSKFWISDIHAIDVAGTFNIQEDFSWVYLHSNFLLHHFDVIRLEEGSLPLYWGGGLKFVLGASHSIGLRAPVGASYISKNSQFETFFEVAPFLDVVENPRFSLHGAMGFRLYL